MAGEKLSLNAMNLLRFTLGQLQHPSIRARSPLAEDEDGEGDSAARYF
jgi:hypothetical protein